MYPLDPKRLAALPSTKRSGVGANVYFLGLTSLFTDISSEMVFAILPIYLLFVVQLSPIQFGFIDGLYQGAAVIVRLAGGVLADRWRRNREVAAAGYALSAVCKLAFLAAGNVWVILTSVVFLDRLGKGIRTAPRDALISLSAVPERLGLAFGIHRAFDTAGALLGPIVAFGLLALLQDAYDVIFVTSFFLALIGLAALLLLVRNPTDVAPRGTSMPVSIGAVMALLRGSRYRALAIAGIALAVVTVADSFIYLGLRERLEFDVSIFPLLYVGTAATYLALAIPAGRIADRVGRGRVFLFGHVMLLLACSSLLIPGGGLATAVLCLGMLGAYYACTDGVLMAMASAFLPGDLRASGLALLATATGLARLLSSVIFGAVWNWWGIELALAVFIVGLTAAMLLAVPTLFRVEESPQHGIAVSG